MHPCTHAPMRDISSFGGDNKNAVQNPAQSHYLILGAGTFGSRAVVRIQHRDPHARITLVDRSPPLSLPAVACVQEDAIEYLERTIDEQPRHCWIIPAVPVHVAARWLAQRLSKTHRVRLVQVPALPLPNVMVGENGDVYASHASFICPDNCSEPQDACLIAKRPHPKPMFELIGDLNSRALPVHCLRSEQIAPGVGGFVAARLLDLCERAMTGGSMLIATACRCHAVVTCVSVERDSKRI